MIEPIDPPPKVTAVDRLSAVARSLVGEFPGVGVVVSIYEQIFGTEITRRQDAWLECVYQLLVELQNREVDLDELGERPEFVTAFRDASLVAAGEHLGSKLDLLKAVLFNAATHDSDPIADLWTLRYLRWIDELEPAHVELLSLGATHRRLLVEHGNGSPDLNAAAQRAGFEFGPWPYDDDVVELLLEDLRDLKLGGHGNADRSVFISDRGLRFLAWLTIV